MIKISQNDWSYGAGCSRFKDRGLKQNAKLLPIGRKKSLVKKSKSNKSELSDSLERFRKLQNRFKKERQEAELKKRVEDYSPEDFMRLPRKRRDDLLKACGV